MPLIENRVSPSGFVSSGKLYVFGGFSKYGELINNIEMLDLAKGTEWKMVDI